MKDQLVQYVELLFAGATGCEDIKQEILQNTLDRYNDLIEEGKTPEAAYRLAIIGIGDINEILGAANGTVFTSPTSQASQGKPASGMDTPTKKLLRAIGIALYILCPVPVLVLDSMGMAVTGFCGLLAMVAAATALMILSTTKDRSQDTAYASQPEESELSKSIGSLIWTIGLAAYFILSFLTGAWYITWVIFLIIPAVRGLVTAILDLKEGE